MLPGNLKKTEKTKTKYIGWDFFPHILCYMSQIMFHINDLKTVLQKILIYFFILTQDIVQGQANCAFKKVNCDLHSIC